MQPKLFTTLQYLTPQHLLSRMVGKLANSEQKQVKNAFITWFMKKYHVNLAEAEITNATQFKNFNAFFTRQLRPDVRPIAENSIISPVDGVIYQYGKIINDRIIQAKNRDFSLLELVGDKENIAKHFINGDFITLYLAPKDYHRIHMPIRGELLETLYIPGKLFSVNPITTDNVPNLFARNERLVCVFETELGKIAVVLVGAMIVASIATRWSGLIKTRVKQPQQIDYRAKNIRLDTGDELGYFQLGSTVILLFPENKITWQKNISELPVVKMGQSLAKKNYSTDD